MGTVGRVIVAATALAAEGVVYDPTHGARCPACGSRMATATTRKWSGGIRVRYHYCQEAACVVSRVGCGVKSVEASSLEQG